MLVYDVTSEESFSQLPNFIDDIQKVNQLTDNINCICVLNKIYLYNIILLQLCNYNGSFSLQNASKDAEVLLLANKCDLEEERSVSEQQGQKFAIQNDLDLMYVSAKTGMNIEEAFMTLAQKIVAKLSAS